MTCAIEFETLERSFVLYKRVTEQYSDPEVLRSVRSLIPSGILSSAASSDSPLVVPLLKWFKGEFMQWMPTRINCPRCDSAPAMQQLVETGSSWKLRKTETHTCPKCGYRLVFPRYAEVLKIAESRTGRCSEWSMLFGAMLSSISMPVRIVQDYLDHCWNEISLDNKNDDNNNNNSASQRWVHVDPTLSFPISLDHPHYYEQNWGKKYLHVLAFDANKVEDVTRRYTEQWDKVTQRREKSDQEGYDEKVFLPENLQALYSTI